jgi:ParB-like chromosome segregation protein Spo0J
MAIQAKAQAPFARKTIPVSSIRVRQGADQGIDPQRIDLVADVIARYGLMDPIVTDADGNLLSGPHLFAAVKRLGWETVEVVVV